jgi:hypothetical protein
VAEPCDYRFRVGDGSRCQAQPGHPIHHSKADGPDEAHEYRAPSRVQEPEQADGMTQAKAREFVEWRGCEVEVV